MKKILLTLSLLAMVLVTFGQTFDLGVKASYNTTKLDLSSSAVKNGFTNGSGSSFGAFGRIGGKKLYLQPELLYSSMTTTYTYSVKNTAGVVISTNTNDVKLKTFQIPILLGLKLLDLKIASLRAFTGPAASFVANKGISDFTTQIKDNFTSNSMAWDWQVGAGVDVLMFTFDIRYDLGLTELKTVTADTFKNRTFTVSLGLKFF
jgi:hypothetical protein